MKIGNERSFMHFDTFPMQLLFEHQISFPKRNIFYRIFFLLVEGFGGFFGVVWVGFLLLLFFGLFVWVFLNVDETRKESSLSLHSILF